MERASWCRRQRVAGGQHGGAAASGRPVSPCRPFWVVVATLAVLVRGATCVCDPWRVYFENQTSGKVLVVTDAQVAPGTCTSTGYATLVQGWCRQGTYSFGPGETGWIFETNNRYFFFFASSADGAQWSRLLGTTTPYIDTQTGEDCDPTASYTCMAYRMVDMGSECRTSYTYPLYISNDYTAPAPVPAPPREPLGPYSPDPDHSPIFVYSPNPDYSPDPDYSPSPSYTPDPPYAPGPSNTPLPSPSPSPRPSPSPPPPPSPRLSPRPPPPPSPRPSPGPPPPPSPRPSPSPPPPPKAPSPPPPTSPPPANPPPTASLSPPALLPPSGSPPPAPAVVVAGGGGTSAGAVAGIAAGVVLAVVAVAAGAGFFIYRKRGRPGDAAAAEKNLHADELTSGGSGDGDGGDGGGGGGGEAGSESQPPGPNLGLDSFLTQPAVPSGSSDGIDTFMTVAVQTASLPPDGNAALSVPWTGTGPAAVGPLQAGITAAAAGGPSSAAGTAAAATGAAGALAAAQLPPRQKAPAAVGLEGPQHSGGSGVQPPTPTLSTPSVLGADAASASRSSGEGLAEGAMRSYSHGMQAQMSAGSCQSLPRTPRSAGSATDLQPWEVPFADLAIHRPVGEGSFGQVYLATWQDTPVCCKVLLAGCGVDSRIRGPAEASKTRTLSTPVLARIQDEARLLVSLRHPNIVTFMGLVPDPPAIITEYCANGSLCSLLAAARGDTATAALLNWPMRLSMLLDAARGMLYLHNRPAPIVHRDLKSPNLVVDDAWRCKVTDFNLSRILEDSSRRSSMTAMNPRWLAPEVMSGEGATPASDVYSFGIVMHEVATFQLPWEASNPWQIVSLVLGGGRPPVPPREQLPGADTPEFAGLDAFLGLMKRCWAHNPFDRPSFERVAGELREMLDQAGGPPLLVPTASGQAPASLSSGAATPHQRSV